MSRWGASVLGIALWMASACGHQLRPVSSALVAQSEPVADAIKPLEFLMGDWTCNSVKHLDSGSVESHIMQQARAASGGAWLIVNRSADKPTNGQLASVEIWGENLDQLVRFEFDSLGRYAMSSVTFGAGGEMHISSDHLLYEPSADAATLTRLSNSKYKSTFFRTLKYASDELVLEEVATETCERVPQKR